MIEDKLYVGTANLKLDTKGRISLSSLVKNQLLRHNSKDTEIDFQNLIFYLYKDLKEQNEGIVLSDSPNLEVDLDYKLSHYKTINPDSQGRINIGDKVSRNILGDTRDIVIVGQLDHFKIYSKDMWERYVIAHEAEIKEVQKKFHAGY